jgi:tetratricopeptide (TPR) repeat protein
MRRFVTAVLCFFLFLSAGFTVSGQEKEIYELPPWLILEYGKKAFMEREYGVALRYAREAIEKRAYFYPEAEILIGDVFEAEGNIELAIEQYEKALENAKQLYIQDEKYEVYYKLAELYDNGYLSGIGTNPEQKYREILETILEDDEEYTDAAESNLGDALVNTLEEDGFDRLVILYRLNSDFSLEAHSRFGRIHLDNGEYKQAALHFIFVVLSVISKAIEELQFHDPEYEFESSESFFEACTRYDLIQNYFEETSLFSNMAALGDAVAAEDDEKGMRDTEVGRRLRELARTYSRNE